LFILARTLRKENLSPLLSHSLAFVLHSSERSSTIVDLESFKSIFSLS
jgi:hypothetical protein